MQIAYQNPVGNANPATIRSGYYELWDAFEERLVATCNDVFAVMKAERSPITDPFLALMREIFWRDGPPTVQDGTFAATWALDHAVTVNPGGINGPVRIAVLERASAKWAARMLDDEDLEEHRQNIDQAKERLRSFPATHTPTAESADVPKPKAVAETGTVSIEDLPPWAKPIQKP